MKFKILAIITIVLIGSCTKDLTDTGKMRVLRLPAETPEYNDQLPAHMNAGWSSSVNNNLVQLGRVLFYDEILSANNRISCASCHLQSKAFSDGKKTSEGFAMVATPRNAPGFCNTFNKSSFFWDARVNSLSQQVVMPITNHIEMGMANLETLVDQINSTDYYQPLITNAGFSEMTESLMSSALSSFVNAAKSYRSEFDKAMIASGSTSVYNPITLPQRLQEGFDLFASLSCRNCHGQVDFGGWAEANIGLDLDYTDNGIWSISGLTTDKGVFRVPSLRNVELTAPYMHDGRFKTLEEVINHYNLGIKPHPNLSPVLTEFDLISEHEFLANGGDPRLVPAGANSAELFVYNHGPRRMNLTTHQIDALVIFLKSLTDRELTTDPRFSDPFVVVEK